MPCVHYSEVGPRHLNNIFIINLPIESSHHLTKGSGQNLIDMGEMHHLNYEYFIMHTAASIRNIFIITHISSSTSAYSFPSLATDDISRTEILIDCPANRVIGLNPVMLWQSDRVGLFISNLFGKSNVFFMCNSGFKISIIFKVLTVSPTKYSSLSWFEMSSFSSISMKTGSSCS